MNGITISGIAFVIITIVMAVKKYPCKFDLILQYLAYFSFVTFIYLHMNWYAVNHYLRYAVAAISLVPLVLSVIKSKKKPFFKKKTLAGWLLAAFFLAALVVFSYYNVLSFAAFGYEDEPIELEFPFKDGLYVVYNGGNGERSPLMNYHMNYTQWRESGYAEGMQYAVDLLKINKAGFFSSGIHPRDAEKYEIFGETVYSPCDGVVYDVSKSSKDLVPFSRPVDYGNRVVIKVDDIYILMVHLKEGSMEVKIGDKVTAGQPIAKVGNSGMTLYPHLHIQATRGQLAVRRRRPHPVRQQVFDEKRAGCKEAVILSPKSFFRRVSYDFPKTPNQRFSCILKNRAL